MRKKQLDRLVHFLSKRFGRKTYGLDNLDLKLAEYVDYKNGFFIEAGANNGIRQSNTLYFERYKSWHGLLIEPIPDLAIDCKKNRPKAIVEACALVSSDFNGSFVEMEYCNLMSIVNSESSSIDIKKHIESGRRFLNENEQVYTIKVPAMTLSEVILKNKIQHVDLLSLDVEGFEAQVLSGINFELHRPEYMLIEVRNKSTIDSIINKYYKSIAVLNTTDSYADVLYKLLK